MIKSFVSDYRNYEVYIDDNLGISLKSVHEGIVRKIYAKAKERGFKCSFEVTTRYDRADALRGGLGILSLGPGSTANFRAVLPKDAFDYSTGCKRCGVGATQVKPHVVSQRSLRSRANFEYGHEGSLRVFMRSEIGHAVIEATGQPRCMRHPVMRGGEIITEWMEAVPGMTMPPLSPTSEGVLLGSTRALSRAGEAPMLVPHCPACGRTVWAESFEYPTRLVYPRAAIEAAQSHGVVSMYEPKDLFPTMNPAKGTFKDLYGLPWLLFSRTAIKAMLRFMQTEHIRDSACFEPVFGE